MSRANTNRPDLDPTVAPTKLEIQRAAGWWGGEGSVNSNARKLTVAIVQKEVAVLLWLRDRFGGSVRSQSSGVCVWVIHGMRARKFLLQIYSLLVESPRRRAQIKKAILETRGERKTGTAPRTVCARGHAKPFGEECKRCRRLGLRLRRSHPDVREKHRLDQKARYWRKKQLAIGLT
jgi:hypothetical protein